MIALALLLAAVGCSGESEPSELTPVQGIVTYRGQPLAGATVVFVPDAVRGNRGELAQAEVGADGSYTLKTSQRYGAAAGWYKVTVAAIEKPSAAPGQSAPLPRSLIPEKYRDPELSGLTCEVQAGRTNGINFHLE